MANISNKKQYHFPVKDKFDAHTVTQPDFEIDLVSNELYAEINPYRVEGKMFIDKLNFNLRIVEGQLVKADDNYVKIIFSGHKGCGKSLELRRYNNFVNDSSRYFSLLIDIERELIVSQFKPEDFFILMVTKLAERIASEPKLRILDFVELGDIAKEWLSEEEVRSEIKSAIRDEAGASSGLGVGLFDFLNFKLSLKSVFSFDSSTSRTIREKVKNNPYKLIERINLVLQKLREEIHRHKLGKDVLFIIDGSEKIDFPVYQELFINRLGLIIQLNSNAIFSVPIRSAYEIQYSSAQSSYETWLLPMVRLNTNAALSHFKQIVSKRVNEKTFFSPGVLNILANKSGGCPRQLLKIVNNCIVESLGGRITKSIAEKVLLRMGREMKERLSTEHLNLIKSGLENNNQYDYGNKEVLDLLLELYLLKYNGDTGLNPLLEPFITTTGSNE